VPFPNGRFQVLAATEGIYVFLGLSLPYAYPSLRTDGQFGVDVIPATDVWERVNLPKE